MSKCFLNNDGSVTHLFMFAGGYSYEPIPDDWKCECGALTYSEHFEEYHNKKYKVLDGKYRQTHE